jgi:hypothetical protein
VVYRRLGKDPKAEQHFALATAAAELAVNSQSESTLKVQIAADGEKDNKTKATLLASFDVTPHRVVADVHFSHGYYCYEREEWEKAADLFRSAIAALESADEEWDSPYTRLAITRLVQGDEEDAAFLFLRARGICLRTPPSKNREASLSMALCSLGLKVIEANQVVNAHVQVDPLMELKEALAIDPPLGLGPLHCHRDDAKKLLARCDNNAGQDLVNPFVLQLEAKEEAHLNRI